MAKTRLGLVSGVREAVSSPEDMIGFETLASERDLTVKRLGTATLKGVQLPYFGVTSPGYSYDSGPASFIKADESLEPAGDVLSSGGILASDTRISDLVIAAAKLEIIRALIFTRRQVAVITTPSVTLKASMQDNGIREANVWASDVWEALSNLGDAKLAIFGLTPSAPDPEIEKIAKIQADFRSRAIPPPVDINLSPADQIRQAHGLPPKIDYL